MTNTIMRHPAKTLMRFSILFLACFAIAFIAAFAAISYIGAGPVVLDGLLSVMFSVMIFGFIVSMASLFRITDLL